jgi:hypothetical protein
MTRPLFIPDNNAPLKKRGSQSREAQKAFRLRKERYMHYLEAKSKMLDVVLDEIQEQRRVLAGLGMDPGEIPTDDDLQEELKEIMSKYPNAAKDDARHQSP